MGVNNFNVMSIGKVNLINPKDVCYEDSIDIIHDELHKTRKSFIKIGWYLKHIDDNKMYIKDGYDNIIGFAKDKFNLSQSTTNRFIRLCEEFSVNHNSPELDKKYENYSVSQLIEMVSMKPEQIEQVTSEMTVREIKEIKQPSKKSIECFYNLFVMNTEYEINRSGLKEYFVEKLGLGHSGGSQRGITYKCSRRGIVLNNSSEITWLNLVKKINEMFPVTVIATDEDDNIPGQTSIEKDFPEYMPDEQISYATSQEQVTTVSDVLLEEEIIEEIETDAEEVDEVQEELSAYGLPKTVYPEGSILSIVGCGHKYACFSCAQDCGIRQENRYCVEAPLANPFSCTTMNVLELLGEEMGDACQFKNQGLAYHTEGSHEPVPCCKQCQEKTCGYRCKRAMSAGMDRAAGKSELDQTKDILEKEKQLLDEYLRIEDLPEFTVKRQKIIVGALANMVCELEVQEAEEEPLEEKQPELGILRNNDQRQEFIEDYEKWPVWIEQPLTGEKYYRYEFENGTAFVVKVYFHKCFDCMVHSKKWEERYKDGWGAEEYYIVKDGKHFKDCLANKSSMIEFLKNLQKGEK